MDGNNQNDSAGERGQTPADQALPPNNVPIEPALPQRPIDQALPPETPPVEPAVNQVPINQTSPAENPPIEMPPTQTSPAENPPVEVPPVEAPPQTPPAEIPVEPAPNSQVPPGYDQPAPPPPPQQVVEPSVEPPVGPQMGAVGGGQALETPTEQPKRSAWKWIVGIIVIAALGGGGYYYYITKIKTSPSSSTSSETTSTGTSSPGTSPTPSSTTKSTIENAYDSATATVATADNAKAVDTVLAPILAKTFTNVKLTDASSMMTYTTNRPILAADVTAVKTELETAGYKAIDSTDKQMTMSKGASTWVITFSVGSETKATIDVTY